MRRAGPLGRRIVVAHARIITPADEGAIRCSTKHTFMWPIVLSLALSLTFQGQAPAQSATSVPAASPSPSGPARSSSDIQFTAHDLAALLTATQSAEKSPDITINVVGKDALDMPTYDPIVHFVGVDTKDAATIWMMKSPPKTQSSARALLAAMELACMATGFAGSNWKAITIRSRRWMSRSRRDRPIRMPTGSP